MSWRWLTIVVERRVKTRKIKTQIPQFPIFTTVHIHRYDPSNPQSTQSQSSLNTPVHGELTPQEDTSAHQLLKEKFENMVEPTTISIQEFQMGPWKGRNPWSCLAKVKGRGGGKFKSNSSTSREAQGLPKYTVFLLCQRNVGKEKGKKLKQTQPNTQQQWHLPQVSSFKKPKSKKKKIKEANKATCQVAES